MRKGFGTAFIVLGLLFVTSACTNARRAPDLAYLMGTYLPGIISLAVGLKLRQDCKLPDELGAEDSLLRLQIRRRSNAEMGVLGGIVLMSLGSGLAQQGHELFLVGTAVLLGGTSLMIWGAVHYMKCKGYSGWWGLLGLLLLPGLILLACFPNRMKELGTPSPGETRKTSPLAMLALVAAVLFVISTVGAFLAIPLILSHTPAKTATVWTTVSSDPPLFTVAMPATPKRQVATQQGPDGDVTVTTYESRDHLVTYTAGLMPFATDLKRGMPQELLEEPLDSILDSSATQMKAQVVYRKSISLGPYFGKEQLIEFTPGIKDRAGEPVVASMVWRLYFVRDTILMLTVGLPKSHKDDPGMDERLARFFDSLQVD